MRLKLFFEKNECERSLYWYSKFIACIKKILVSDSDTLNVYV